MRCTTCSRVIKPVVALDIDGTLGDYHSHLLEFMEGYFGCALPHDWTGEPADWEVYLDITQAEYRDAKLAFRQGGMKRTMPMFPGARTLAASARIAGAEVWITTTRPYNRMDSVDPDTKEWLRRNEIHYDHLLYDDAKYVRLAELVDKERVVFVLDDLADQIEEARWIFGDAAHTIVRNHNLTSRKGLVLQNLQQANKVMTQRIHQWEQMIHA